MHALRLLSPNSFQYIHSYHIISIWNELSFQTPYLRLIALATSNINILELPNLQYCIVSMFSSTGSDSESDDSDVTQYKAVTCTGAPVHVTVATWFRHNRHWARAAVQQ